MNEFEEKRQKLFSACESGDKGSLKELAKSGVTPSSYNMINTQGKSPLHVACRYGHIDIVRMLVEIYGCSPKAVDNTGSTPFHDACYYDQVLIVDYFIQTSSNPKEYLLMVDFNGNTPFHKANQSGSVRVIKYILHTILVGHTPQKLCLDIDYVICYRDSLNEINMRYLLLKNKVGDNPLAVACRHGHLDVIKIYMHYQDHLHGFSMPVNIASLLKTANQCGQFEIVYYLQSNYGHIIGNLSETKMSMYYDDDESYSQCHHYHRHHTLMNVHEVKCDLTVNVKSPKCWNNVTLKFSCGNSTIKSFCMAILHDNEMFYKMFFALQHGKFITSDIVAACLAACVSDNVDVLNQLLNDKILLTSGKPLLYIACEWGSKKAVEFLITKGKCDLNATNDLGETPLHVACRHGKVEIVQLFLNTSQYDYMLDKVSLSSETPLHLACLQADSTLANLILDHCQLSNLDSTDKYGDTPLMNACHSGSVHLVERLIEMRCNPLYVNNVTKEIPVHVACRLQRLDILKVLLKDFSGKVDHRNHFGETPLCAALNTSCKDIANYIIQRGFCDVSLSLFTTDTNPDSDNPEDHTSDSVTTKYYSSILPFNLTYGEVVSVSRQQRYRRIARDKAVHLTSKQISLKSLRKQSGDNALHFACRRNDLELLKLLVYHSPASVTVVNTFGQTPLHLAAQNGSVSLMECLIANCNVPLDSVINFDGNSILHLACIGGTLKVVKILLECCSVTLKNKDGNTPIHIACYNKLAILVGCLLERCSGNFDDYRNNNSDTFLHIAAKVGDLDTIKLLLKHCSPTSKNTGGDTPIHIACSENNQSVLECLLESNTSTQPLLNKQGQTYLHVACNEKAQLKLVETIFYKGYKSLGSHPDKNGDIPLHYVCRSGQKDIVEFLMTDNRCNPYWLNSDGLSPLYCALKRNHFKLI